MILDELDVWFDPLKRKGPEAMAVDEWLLGKVEKPLLRIYEWEGDWGSLGYFSRLEEARNDFPGLDFVRRWTGGGVVDHRADWTYSLILPKSSILAGLKGGESYRQIHEVLAEVLRKEGAAAGLAEGESGGGESCFRRPVKFDVMSSSGEKVAGAAQRRSKFGLLHQGSVAGFSEGRLRGEVFAGGLAGAWEEVFFALELEEVLGLVGGRYGCEGWLERC